MEQIDYKNALIALKRAEEAFNDYVKEGGKHIEDAKNELSRVKRAAMRAEEAHKAYWVNYGAICAAVESMDEIITRLQNHRNAAAQAAREEAEHARRIARMNEVDEYGNFLWGDGFAE